MAHDTVLGKSGDLIHSGERDRVGRLLNRKHAQERVLGGKKNEHLSHKPRYLSKRKSQIDEQIRIR